MLFEQSVGFICFYCPLVVVMYSKSTTSS